MLDYIVPEDNETNDNAVRKQVIDQVKEPVDTGHFSREEIAYVIKSLILKRLMGRMD